ncbi:putative damage-inducible protein DinB [Bacillus mesophilus]|uniref:DinB family protein n=1 Tax=Bacillus mesophilus TaxID=1808955 RepID=A0A6M0QA83_9BACI|nr:putative damage-inducible protein DinB [Bacillus mesophilus]NEY72639.1 DinB family protein [Bacillus mesophilus]
MDHNNQVREELLQIVSEYTDEQLNERLDDTSWSIMQNLEHLYLIERLVTNSIKKELLNESSESADPKPIQFTVDRSRKVKAPSNIEPSDEFITLVDIKNKLIQSREALTQVANSDHKDHFDKKSFAHPVFGLLSLTQWIEFIGFHEKRHLAQIQEITQYLKETS